MEELVFPVTVTGRHTRVLGAFHRESTKCVVGDRHGTLRVLRRDAPDIRRRHPHGGRLVASQASPHSRVVQGDASPAATVMPFHPVDSSPLYSVNETGVAAVPWATRDPSIVRPSSSPNSCVVPAGAVSVAPAATVKFPGAHPDRSGGESSPRPGSRRKRSVPRRRITRRVAGAQLRVDDSHAEQ